MIYSKITLIILIVSLLVQWRRYRSRFFLHPSLYFLGIWILSVISFEVFLLAGFKKLVNNINILNELFVYISFTALCFLFFSFKGYKSIRDSVINMELLIPHSFYKIISLGFFIISFIGLFFVSGFDVASNRAAEVIATTEFYGSSSRYSIIQLIFNVLNMLIIPFTLYGGWMIGRQYFGGEKKMRLIYLLPLFTELMNVVAGGGRAGIISVALFFILGLLFALFSEREDYWTKSKGLVKYGVVFLFMFFLYTNFVSTSRSRLESRENLYFSSLEQYKELKPFYGIMEYLIFHYEGYQWRRLDSTTPELELGRKTFSFVLDFNVPVISQIIGHDISLKNIFNLKDIDTVRGTIQAKKRNLPESSITATVYYVLFDDFGYYGVFLITFLFVGLTEKLYRNLFEKQNYNFWSIILFIAIFKLWTSTIFSHHLTGAWFNGFLYPILLIELAGYFARHRSNKLLRSEFARF